MSLSSSYFSIFIIIIVIIVVVVIIIIIILCYGKCSEVSGTRMHVSLDVV